ncbi:MAG: chitobiase/beta-hexosaminidase C-terminal domain-containing protein [Candidatus Binatia bacterium]
MQKGLINHIRIQANLLKVHFLIAGMLLAGLVNPIWARSIRLITFSDIKPAGETLHWFWHGIGMDHNQRIYVAIGNGKEREGGLGDVLIFEYDTRSGKRRFLKSVRQILKKEGNLGPNRYWPKEEGVAKVHSDIFKYNGKMYFSTHDHHSFKHIEKHRGGHFISYDPATEEFADLSKSDPQGVSVVHEGIIAINVLPQEHKLVGWTFPLGHVLLFDLMTGKTTRYDRGLREPQKSNVARVVIATKRGSVFAAYSSRNSPKYLFKLDRQLGRLIPTTNSFRRGFFEGLAMTSDGNTAYLADLDGELYSLDVNSEKLEALGSILPSKNVAPGERVRLLENLTLSRDERKLFTIPHRMTQGKGAYHLYEYDIESGDKNDLGDLSSVLKGSTLTGNGVMDEKGFMYISFYNASGGIKDSQRSGIVQVDVRDRVKPTANPPVFKPYGGLFSGSVEVSLTTSTADSTIHYTTNGNDPTLTSAVYTKPLHITKSTFIKARAFTSGLIRSSAASATFIIDLALPTGYVSSLE